MTTSGVITGTLTVRQIVSKAYTLLGVKDAVTPLSAEDANEGMDSLNWMLKSWQADGNNLWRREDTTMVWPLGVQTGQLDPQIIDILSLRWVLNDVETPMLRYSLEEWDRLPTKNDTGTPIVWKFIKLRSSVEVSLWPIPEVATTIYGDMARIVETVTDLDETIDLPQEWTEAVFYNLAWRLADISGKTGERTNRVIANAQQLYQKLRGHDREPSLRMVPARRYYGRGYGYGSGRC